VYFSVRPCLPFQNSLGSGMHAYIFNKKYRNSSATLKRRTSMILEYLQCSSSRGWLLSHPIRIQAICLDCILPPYS
jgi:hypothetical protein